MNRKQIGRRQFVTTLATTTLAAPLAAGDFKSGWPQRVDSEWLGPAYWANPLQEWRLKNGRIENIIAGGDRNVYLLTRELSEESKPFQMSVLLGRLEEDRDRLLEEGFVGFRIGIRGHFEDYRDSAVRGEGLHIGVATDGRLFIGAPTADGPRIRPEFDQVRLEVKAEPEASGAYTLTLQASAHAQQEELVRKGIAAKDIAGGVALVASSGTILPTPAPLTPMVPNGGAKPGTERGGTVRFWFQNWMLSGDKVAVHEDRAFGPILFAMHTLSRGILKMTVQMAPVPGDDPVQLEVQEGDRWQPVGTSKIDPLSRTAHFRIANWSDTADRPYRLKYTLRLDPAQPTEQIYTGTIRKEPRDKQKLTIGALTCNNDFGFPHSDLTRHLSHFRPDILLFTGDQIYERVAEYGIQMAPLEPAALDYLRKWYLFGWAFRDLLRDTPSVAIPDDHDVYHGNIWGEGGEQAKPPLLSIPAGEAGSIAPANRTKAWQDSGGYKMPAEWVNMVQRTQTSHLPDPFDPTPVKQGITVYYTSLLYGGLSFAILEDRKWKSPPTEMIPWAKIENGWAQNPEYDARKHGDVKGAELLGERQIRFLEDWSKDWTGGAFSKIVVSQTIFANVVTLPPPANNDDVTPRLELAPPGQFIEGEVLVQDHDSNGWPQTPRNRALQAMRQGLAFQVAGDQHLGSTVQYGIEAFNDGPWALCTPAISNLWPRRWYPPQPGVNGQTRYTGGFLDGFGNRVTVHAVANPAKFGVQPEVLYNRAPGYGIIEIDRKTRKVRMTNWPRWVDPSGPRAKPYDGWPIEIHQLDNGLNGATWVLDPVSLKGLKNPAVEVREASSGSALYTVRAPEGNDFTPKVWKQGDYLVRVFEPEGRKEQVHKARAMRHA